MATDVEGLYAAVKALVCVVHSNKAALREMERTKGYQVRFTFIYVTSELSPLGVDALVVTWVFVISVKLLGQSWPNLQCIMWPLLKPMRQCVPCTRVWLVISQFASLLPLFVGLFPVIYFFIFILKISLHCPPVTMGQTITITQRFCDLAEPGRHHCNVKIHRRWW